MLTQEDIEQIIRNARADLTEQVRASVKESVKRHVDDAVYREIDVIVKEYVKAELGPAIRDALVGEKSILIDVAVKACNGLAEAISQAMMASLTKQLATDWERDKLIGALFGGRS